MLCPSWLEEDQKAEQAKKLYESGFSAHMKAMRQGLRVKKGTIYNRDAHSKKHGKSKSPPAVPLGSDFRRGRRRVAGARVFWVSSILNLLFPS